MDSKKLAQLCREFADNKKAENILILDVRDLSSVTDYFVIASGTSEPHLRAIVDVITDRLREDHNVRPRAMDGTVWIIEIKGREELDLPQKMARLKLWCADATAAKREAEVKTPPKTNT